MLEQMIDRIPIALILIISGLICYTIAMRPALSKREKKELKELDNVISETYGGKK